MSEMMKHAVFDLFYYAPWRQLEERSFIIGSFKSLNVQCIVYFSFLIVPRTLLQKMLQVWLIGQLSADVIVIITIECALHLSRCIFSMGSLSRFYFY